MKNYILLIMLVLVSATGCKNEIKEPRKTTDGESQAAMIEATSEQNTEQ